MERGFDQRMPTHPYLTNPSQVYPVPGMTSEQLKTPHPDLLRMARPGPRMDANTSSSLTANHHQETPKLIVKNEYGPSSATFADPIATTSIPHNNNMHNPQLNLKIQCQSPEPAIFPPAIQPSPYDVFNDMSVMQQPFRQYPESCQNGGQSQQYPSHDYVTHHHPVIQPNSQFTPQASANPSLIPASTQDFLASPTPFPLEIPVQPYQYSQLPTKSHLPSRQQPPQNMKPVSSNSNYQVQGQHDTTKDTSVSAKATVPTMGDETMPMLAAVTENIQSIPSSIPTSVTKPEQTSQSMPSQPTTTDHQGSTVDTQRNDRRSSSSKSSSTDELDNADSNALDDDNSTKNDKPAVPAFISKLMTMLNDSNTDHLISWTENGQTFKVHDAATLAKEVLPQYFKHSNFTSLVRQLNTYGFHKVVGVNSGLKTASDQIWEFVHPCVRRDKPHLLNLVRRKDGSSVRRKMQCKDVDTVMQDLGNIKDEQSYLSSKFNDMQRQNAALWQEVSQLRTKHHQQQRMISKIIVFLSRLVRHPQPPPVNGPSQKRPKTLALESLSDAHQQHDGGSYLCESPIWDLPPPPTSEILTPNGALFDNLSLEGVENIIGPELNSYDERLRANKERLLQSGIDPSLLHSLWDAAKDDSESFIETQGNFSVANDLHPLSPVQYSDLKHRYFGVEQPRDNPFSFLS